MAETGNRLMLIAGRRGPPILIEQMGQEQFAPDPGPLVISGWQPRLMRLGDHQGPPILVNQQSQEQFAAGPGEIVNAQTQPRLMKIGEHQGPPILIVQTGQQQFSPAPTAQVDMPLVHPLLMTLGFSGPPLLAAQKTQGDFQPTPDPVVNVTWQPPLRRIGLFGPLLVQQKQFSSSPTAQVDMIMQQPIVQFRIGKKSPVPAHVRFDARARVSTYILNRGQRNRADHMVGRFQLT